jgi:hypothetical protein
MKAVSRQNVDLQMNRFLKAIHKYLSAPSPTKNVSQISSCTDLLIVAPLKESSYRKSIWKSFSHIDISLEDSLWILTQIFELYQPHGQSLSSAEMRKELLELYHRWVEHHYYTPPDDSLSPPID